MMWEVVGSRGKGGREEGEGDEGSLIIKRVM